MQLSIEQIRSIAHGATRVEQEGETVTLSRFTAEQEEYYRNHSAGFYGRAIATAGISLEMDTDSSVITLSVEVSHGCGFYSYVHSVFVDGQRVGELSGYLRKDEPCVRAESVFQLPPGMKRVKIQFPWTERSRIRAVTLEDGAFFQPVPKKRKMLIFGDSITQGYIAELPEHAYAVRLADALEADAVNKAIGGERYCPELAKLPDPVVPDLILVAYGANDWNAKGPERFEHESVAFHKNLRSLYPEAKIVVLAPIWSGLRDLNRPEWPFRAMAEHLMTLPHQIENLICIDCFPFVEHHFRWYVEGVHPNDEGHRQFADALIEQLEGL